MLVDHERVLLGIKEKILEKRSWGSKELFLEIARLEVEHQLDGDVSDPTVLTPPSDKDTEDHSGEGRESRPGAMSGSQTPLLAGGARNGSNKGERGD